MLGVKRLHPDAVVPTLGHPDSAGCDLYAAKDDCVHAHGKAVIPTGIAVELPAGTYGRVANRSSMSVRNHIQVAAGVIDPGYTGEIGVVLFNHSSKDYMIRKHDRVAQLILERSQTPTVIEVDELCESARGERGFGSTGN
jgi:dUTP pyrophosphatase